MAALSDYLESGVLNHIFRDLTFAKPSNIAIALTSGVAIDSQDGSSIPELPQTYDLGSTGYARMELGAPSNGAWHDAGVDDDTAFAVQRASIGDAGGFRYPLYLKESIASSADTGQTTGFTPFTFPEFEGITFYAPSNLSESGVLNPGYVTYEGNGFIKNKNQIIFPTALSDWGFVSGIAILDHKDVGSGNLLMYAELSNPRQVYTGDSIKFDQSALEISLK